MNRWTVLLTALLFCTIAVLGCSGGGGTPVTPGTGPGITTGTPTHGAQTQTHLWGYWNCYVDIENQTVEAIPDRSVMFSANVVTFLNGQPTGLMFVINETPVDPSFIDVDIDVTLTHPLAGMPRYDGYDVKGVFIGNGSKTLSYDSALSYGIQDTDQTMLEDPDPASYPGDVAGGGPDGFTRWFNPIEFTVKGVLGFTEGKLASKNYLSNSTLNPYKYFADGFGKNDDVWTWLNANPTTNGVFASGMSNTRNYYLRFPNAVGVNYDYAVVASWKGEDLAVDHPAPAPESPGCLIDDNSTLYYVDGTKNGGWLIMDISLFHWPFYSHQPSSISVETNVLTTNPYKFDATEMIPVGGDANYSTYHFEVESDSVPGLTGNWLWVISQYDGYNYGNPFGVPNAAETLPLAAFFKFGLTVGTIPPCPKPEVTGMDPDHAGSGQNLDDAAITGTDFENGPDLAVKLTKAGETDIVGTDLKFVSATKITADFDLAGGGLGFWSLEMVNGCGTPTTAPDIFEIVEAGPKLKASGDLPGPHATNTEHDLCVVGSNSFGHRGVYYHYSTSPTAIFQVFHYENLDYSAQAVAHITLVGNYGYTPGQLLLNDDYLRAIEVMAQGTMFNSNWWTGPMGWGGYPADGAVCWWNSTGLLENGWLYFNMQFHDLERSFSLTGRNWGYWGNKPAGVDGATGYFDAGYGSSNFGSYTGYYPADHVGSVDGMVSDNEAFWCGIDSDPQGLSAPFNIIWYYMEGPPDAYGIEVFENVATMAFPVSLFTIDDPYEGTGVFPEDVTVANTYGNATGAEGNWACVLENNGDTTWNLAVFTQEGDLIGRLGPYNGTPWHCDADETNIEVHVWCTEGGTPKYYIFEFI